MIDIAIRFHDAVIGLLGLTKTDVQHVGFRIVVRPYLTSR